MHEVETPAEEQLRHEIKDVAAHARATIKLLKQLCKDLVPDLNNNNAEKFEFCFDDEGQHLIDRIGKQVNILTEKRLNYDKQLSKRMVAAK